MSEIPEYNGKCPVADNDDEPELVPENDIIVELYNLACETAKTASIEKNGYVKVYSYIKPPELKALMDMSLVEIKDRPRIMKGIFLMQELANTQRRAEKIKTKS